MPKLLRKAAIAIKRETTPGTDSVPTGALNAMLVRNWTLTPLEQQLEDRDLVRPYLGNDEQIAVATWQRMDFEIEFAGAGAPGDLPKYGAALRACGFSETVVPATSVIYALVSNAFDSATIYVDVDGLLHKMTHARGSVAIMPDARKIPVFRFSFLGLYLPVADGSLPGVVYTGFQKPLGVNKANTTATLHGQSVAMESLTLDLKNQVEYRNLINVESVQITDRKPDGSISFEATSIATKNWFQTANDASTGTLSLVHGTAAGNIMQIDSPGVQLSGLRYADSQGIAMFQSNLRLVPGANGNDELTITVR